MNPRIMRAIMGISAFIKMLFNGRRNEPFANLHNIQVNYFSDIETARQYLESLNSEEWEIISQIDIYINTESKYRRKRLMKEYVLEVEQEQSTHDVIRAPVSGAINGIPEELNFKQRKIIRQDFLFQKEDEKICSLCDQIYTNDTIHKLNDCNSIDKVFLRENILKEISQYHTDNESENKNEPVEEMVAFTGSHEHLSTKIALLICANPVL
jgi:hypothetical protein